ncbi:MAG: Rrf2 family transcriptional regulator [Betaproteobacteria bacterium]|nr:Rrf2 family transcriptional regulator [Betaproteobacteria bacterium]
MRLTRYTDFAIRVMLYLAAHEDRLCSIGEIAKAHGISQNHLMKVVSDLAGSGYVQSLRGRSGGLRLARTADQVNIGHMIRHTEGKVDLVGCGECPLAPACGMVCVFKDAVENFFVTLDQYSLADIMTKGQPERLRLILAPGGRPSEQSRPGRAVGIA